MQLMLDDPNTKKLMRELLIELMQDRRDLFQELIVEALEEIGMADAIREGRQDQFVDEAEITALLESGA